MPFQCPYCRGQFCPTHRLPESHECSKMELARTQKQEGVMVQKPSSYELTVTMGSPRRSSGRVYFSPKELKHLTVAALLVVGIGLSLFFYQGFFGSWGWIVLTAFSGLLMVSFLTHEIAHKVIAQRRGLWAEFRLTLWGAVITVFSIFLPFKLIAPGAVMISGSANPGEIAKISIAGPITNIVFSSVFLGATLIPNPFSPIIFLLAYFNGFIAVFNLIPFGILDGYKIFSWSKRLWAIPFAVSIALTLISAVPLIIMGIL
jgi:Zn-dependent protease